MLHIHADSKYGHSKMTKLNKKPSWVIPRDCIPASNSLKVRNLSPSVFHCLKAVFVSFFLTLVEVLPISKIISLFEKFSNWLSLVSQILPIRKQTYSSLQLQNNFTAEQTIRMEFLTETLSTHHDLWQCAIMTLSDVEKPTYRHRNHKIMNPIINKTHSILTACETQIIWVKLKFLSKRV